MKITIGKTDKADFPELFLTNIDIKVDTGAYTSTIHSHEISEIIIDGEKYVEFQILDPTHEKYHEKKFKTKHYRKKRVKNSFGKSEQRFVVETIINFFGKDYPIELSLSGRCDMRFPVLIGRKLLKNKFIVDVSKSNLSYSMKKSN